MGAGAGRGFTLDDARYGRIVILCDADVDEPYPRTLADPSTCADAQGGKVYAAGLATTKIGDDVVLPTAASRKQSPMSSARKPQAKTSSGSGSRAAK